MKPLLAASGFAGGVLRTTKKKEKRTTDEHGSTRIGEERTKDFTDCESRGVCPTRSALAQKSNCPNLCLGVPPWPLWFHLMLPLNRTSLSSNLCHLRNLWIDSLPQSFSSAVSSRVHPWFSSPSSSLHSYAFHSPNWRFPPARRRLTR